MDAVFWISFTTIIVSVLGVAFRYCYKTKCSDISIGFGCINIHRDIEQEIINRECNATI